MNFDAISSKILIKMDYELEIWEREISDEIYNEYDEKYEGKKEIWEETLDVKYDQFLSNTYMYYRNILYNKLVTNLEEFQDKMLEEIGNLKRKIDQEIKNKLEN